MAIVLTIGGNVRTLNAQSLNINEAANYQNTCTFEVISLDASFRASINDEVLIVEDGNEIFAGYLNAPIEVGLGGHGVAAIVNKCVAVGYDVIFDRRIVNEVIPAGDLIDALTVLEAYVTDFGVTLDPSQVTGPPLPALTFNYIPLRECLEQIRTLTDFVYEIDYTQLFRMFAPSTLAAPFDVTTANGNADGDIEVETTREQFANRIYAFGGSGSAIIDDTLAPGDGTTTNFVLNYPYLSGFGYVTANGVFETLGPGATWTHDPVTNSITRVSAPGVGHVIIIKYTAQYPFMVTATISPTPAAIDIVETTLTYPNIFDRNVLQGMIDEMVNVTGVDKKRVTYVTYESGIRPGMTQTITVAERNLSGTFLITDVVTDNPTGNLVRRTVNAISGSVYAGSWRDTIVEWSETGASGAVAAPSGTSSSTGPGLPTASVQFNRGGAFGGHASLTFIEASQSLVGGEDSSITAANAQSCFVYGFDCHIADP